MGRLIFAVIFVVALYSGYWFIGAGAVENRLATSAAEARLEGWQIDYGALDTTGFPGTFDVGIAQPDVTAPDGQWAWRAPSLQVFAPSIRPTRLSVNFPDSQTLRLGDQTLQITSTDLQVSAGTRLDAALSFDATSVDVTDANVQSDFGWQISLDHMLASFAVQPETDRIYDISVDADALVLPPELFAQFVTEGSLENTVCKIVLNSAITLNTPLNRFAFDGSKPPPVVEKIVLSGFDLNWGEIDLNAEGTLDFDAEGVPEGRVTIKTAQWQAIIDILVNTGTIDARIAPTLARTASAMADDSGMLFAPITFRGGFMLIGLVPIGPAPRLR
jgi:hypothetical protein